MDSYSSSSDGHSGCYGSGCFGCGGYATDSSGGLSILSTSTTYGTYGSWTGGDTHASGYEADLESLASNK